MLPLPDLEISLSSSLITIFRRKYPCKVNQPLFDGRGKKIWPQIVVELKNAKDLDSTQTEDALNTT